MRVVLDTNIIVLGYLSPHAPPARVTARVQAGALTMVVSEPLLAEYARVLNYPRLVRLHQMQPKHIAAELERVRGFALLVILEHIPNVIPEDPSDNIVVATALGGEAEYVIAGDDHLLRLGSYQGIRVLRAASFLTLLASEV